MHHFNKRLFNRIVFGAGFACALLLPGLAAAQNVLWEDYRGDNGVADDADYIGAPGAPKFPNYPNDTAMAPFRALTADPGNAARTGSSPNIDFRQSSTSQAALCDSDQGSLSDEACLYQAQGRVLYSRISFPEAGAYTLAAAHDDNLVVELSSDYTNPNYRTASYDLPVGQLAAWTLNDVTFEDVGSFNAASANSCALIRVYWTNQEGINHNRLQWTKPDGTTEIVPASAFGDPSVPADPAECTGSITGEGRAITLNKILGSARLDSSDQFVIEIATSQAGGTVRSAATSGSGTGQQASTGAFPAAASTTYYLREAMAAGSASALTGYTAAIACTNNGTAMTPTPVGSPDDRTWSVATSGGDDQIVCDITNTGPSVDLSIQKSADPTSVVSGGSVQYTVVATNNGPDAVTGAVVTDTPGAGLTCPPANPVTCTSSATPSACPAGALTVQNLLSGVALGALGDGETATFTFTCTAD
ncbi:MAG: hypothetical protein QM761_13160 [Pseudoxanthomonas sp.]